MIVYDQGAYMRLCFDEWDTYDWCARWPGSGFRGDRISATVDFESGDLAEITVNGRHDFDADGSAISAIVADFLSIARLRVLRRRRRAKRTR